MLLPSEAMSAAPTAVSAEPAAAPEAADRGPDAEKLLTVRGLKVHFPVKRGVLQRRVGAVRAVDGIGFDLARGETLGLVGESGCGKSTAGRAVLRLVPADAGEVVFDGHDVLAAKRREMLALRRRMQIVFQDPVASLNPRMLVGSILTEPLVVHGICSPAEARDRVADLLVKVGLEADHAGRYPHAFSGGQRQRIGIARALALGPEFIVCDEPVSALDVSVQGQVLNLLSDLQDELGLSYLFIAHNLAVVEHFCDRVAVMYLGRIVEVAPRDTLYRDPRHPYTRALLSAAPTPDPAGRRDRSKQRILLEGDVPSPIFLDGAEPPEAADPSDPAPSLEAANGQAGTVRRKDLLVRPPLVPVPGSPNHLVSPGPGVSL